MVSSWFSSRNCKPEGSGTIYLKWQKRKACNKEYSTSKALAQIWCTNQKLYRHAKDEIIQHQQTSFTTNVERSSPGWKGHNWKQNKTDKIEKLTDKGKRKSLYLLWFFRHLHNFFFLKFLLLWGKNCSRYIFWSSLSGNWIFSLIELWKHQKNGNLKAQCLLNTVDKSEFPSQAVRVFICYQGNMRSCHHDEPDCVSSVS